MFDRVFVGLLVVFAVTLLTPPAWAQEKTHEGTVVSTAEGKLVMTDKAGQNEHTHMVPATAKVTIDGKAGKLTDLKKGDAVKVTVDDTGKVSAVAGTHAAKG